METQSLAERLERTRPEYAPAGASETRAPNAHNAAALVAGAVFAAGVASFIVFTRPSVDPQAQPQPVLPQAPRPVPVADASVLVPFSGEPKAAPQYEDGLVPFSVLSPIVNEGPLAPAFEPHVKPLVTRELAFRMPPPQEEAMGNAMPELPALERGRAGAVFQTIRLFNSGARLPNVQSREALDARSARGAALWAAARAAAAALLGAAPRVAQAAMPGEDPAHALYRGVVELNGGYDYRNGDTNDFADGYAVCHRAGFRCKPQDHGMVIDTPEGARITHSYVRERNPRNAIFVLLPGAAAAQEISHCPLVFDLSGRGVRTSDKAVRFDVDGRGRLEMVHDVASDTGVLAFDGDHNGIAGSTGRELFGDGTDLNGDGLPDGYLDGFDALDAFVRRAERQGVLLAGTADAGLLTAADLAALHKRYGLSLRLGSLAGRAVSPAEAGVREIRLSTARSIRVENFDAQLNDVVRRQGATFVRADGSTGSYEDVFFRYERPGLKTMAFAK